MAPARVDMIANQCLLEWHQTIFAEFCDRGNPWIVTYDAPAGFTAFRHGMVDFEIDEIRACFAPTVSLIRGMVKAAIRRMQAVQAVSPSVSAAPSRRA